MTEPNFDALRTEFPVLGRKTYLNSGSYCALANDVKAAFEAYMEDRLLVGANWDLWITKNESVRAPDRTAPARRHPTRSRSPPRCPPGLNALASALDFSGPRNKIVVSDFEFPTNAQIWHAQEPRGARVVHVPRAADGYIPLENVRARRSTSSTQLVAITHVCFRNGAKLDIPGIVRLARAKGAKVLLDCYQSVGSLGHRRQGARCRLRGRRHAQVSAGHGRASAFCMCATPYCAHWFRRTAAGSRRRDIAAMDITANRPAPSARRFEAGTPPVVNCYASEAGLRVPAGGRHRGHRAAQLLR